MKSKDTGQLLLLAAIWGSSFLFARLSAPEFGALPMAALRVTVAALFLLPFLYWGKHVAVLRGHWRPIFTVGLLNSALPFLCFAYAAMHISAGLAAMFNAATPLFGAAVAWVWLGDRLTRMRTLGLCIGFVGVLWLAWDKASVKAGSEAFDTTLAIAACLTAACLYGVASAYTKKHLSGVAPMAVSCGSQMSSSLALLPVSLLFWPTQVPSAKAWGAVLAIGVLCTGVAYVIFYRLISRVGPANAMTVTFLIPVFAMIWGALFLGEPITRSMVIGGSIIFAGTSLATGLISADTMTRWAQRLRIKH